MKILMILAINFLMTSCLLTDMKSNLVTSRDVSSLPVDGGKDKKDDMDKKDPGTGNDEIKPLVCSGHKAFLEKKAGDIGTKGDKLEEVCEQETEGYEKTVVIFSEEWCGPCRSLKSQLKSNNLHLDMNNRIKIYYISRDSSHNDFKDFSMINRSSTSLTSGGSIPSIHIFEKDSSGNIQRSKGRSLQDIMR